MPSSRILRLIETGQAIVYGGGVQEIMYKEGRKTC